MASPQIKPIQVGDQTPYRFVVGIGQDPVLGKRKQLTSAATRSTLDPRGAAAGLPAWVPTARGGAEWRVSCRQHGRAGRPDAAPPNDRRRVCGPNEEGKVDG